jgi:branched-chain amino acid transport system permease protein
MSVLAQTTASPVRIVRRTRVSTIAAIVVAAGIPVLVSVPWWASQARLRDLVEFFTLLALGQMWNLLAGYAGLVSIGQQAFIGLGAYGLYLIADRGVCTRSRPSRSPALRRRRSPC